MLKFLVLVIGSFLTLAYLFSLAIASAPARHIY